MKTQKINSISTAIIMAVFVIYFSSCTKEDTAPAGNENASTELANTSEGERNCNNKIFAPQSHPYGCSYAQWSAKWWKWAMEYPMTGHPFVDDPSFSVSNRQSGKVWYLAAPFGNVVRNVNVPHSKALFVGLLNAEASNLEGLGNTYVDQHANAQFNADHIINLTCTIDGSPVSNINSFRFASQQFTFNAPSPWIFGATGGAGTASADGYYVMLKPLHHGMHVLHYTGSFHFTLANDGFDFDAPLDMTYNLNVQ